MINLLNYLFIPFYLKYLKKAQTQLLNITLSRRNSTFPSPQDIRRTNGKEDFNGNFFINATVPKYVFMNKFYC